MILSVTPVYEIADVFATFIDTFKLQSFLPYILGLVIAVICGAAIGVERTLRQKEAGIRTHIIVALGSALIMIVSKYGFFDLMSLSDSVKLDGARLAAQVVTGISFLGAGIIDQLQDASKFLTQAEGATGSGMDGGTGEETAGIVSSLDVEMLLSNIKLGTDLVDIVTMLINSIFDIVSRSGVQMLIFLSGLQSISPAIYESCQVEGATAWETFWKITLPMISPMILVNAVYTIIDMFTAADNRVMKSISDMISGSGMSSMKPGLASAMGWTYIGVILVVIVLIAILMKSIVFYQRRD